MATIYQPSSSGPMTLTVEAPSVNPPTTLVPTKLVLQFYDADGTTVATPTVKPGAVLKAKATLTEATGGAPVPGMDVTFTVEFVVDTPDMVTVVGPTDANGVAVYDLTPLIAAAVPTNEGYGGWSVTAAFLGKTV